MEYSFKIYESFMSHLVPLWISDPTLSGLSRANIYANYKDLFEKTAPVEDRKQHKKLQVVLKEKETTLQALREENRSLKDTNNKLMDELVAMKILLEKCYNLR